eukprot:m.16680 g.16680  ORF g.16680 m.16680 type:complete len:117 (+) comp5079_c0_seq1:50-400(+)
MADRLHDERLKAAVGYTVGHIVKQFEETTEGPTFSKNTVSLLSDLVYRQTEVNAADLQQFARHAKRTTVNMEDVKLLARRSESMHEHVTEVGERMGAQTKEHRAKGKKAASAAADS